MTRVAGMLARDQGGPITGTRSHYLIDPVDYCASSGLMYSEPGSGPGITFIISRHLTFVGIAMTAYGETACSSR